MLKILFSIQISQKDSNILNLYGIMFLVFHSQQV